MPVERPWEAPISAPAEPAESSSAPKPTPASVGKQSPHLGAWRPNGELCGVPAAGAADVDHPQGEARASNSPGDMPSMHGLRIRIKYAEMEQWQGGSGKQSKTPKREERKRWKWATEKKKEKKKKKKEKKTRSSTSRENFPAQDALNRMKPTGCSCERPEATETFIAEHLGNPKCVPTIDAIATSYGINVQSTESIQRSNAQGKGWST